MLYIYKSVAFKEYKDCNIHTIIGETIKTEKIVLGSGLF